MKQNIRPHAAFSTPQEEDVRDYAYHLYVQGGCVPGHDLDNWLEAEACLSANIPTEHSHSRLHRHMSGARKADLLAAGPAG